jgi:hypothetical protein
MSSPCNRANQAPKNWPAFLRSYGRKGNRDGAIFPTLIVLIRLSTVVNSYVVDINQRLICDAPDSEKNQLRQGMPAIGRQGKSAKKGVETARLAGRKRDFWRSKTGFSTFCSNN